MPEQTQVERFGNRMIKKFFSVPIRTVAFIISFLVCGESLQAQEIAVPVSIQYPLFLKILSFDRNLKPRMGEAVVIGIVYQAKFKTSNHVKNDLVSVMNEYPVKSIDNLPISFCLLDMSGDLDLEAVIAKNKIDILYVAPVRALSLKSLTEASRAKSVTTITGVPEYVDSGVAIGIGMKGGNPQILINLAAAKAEGIDFSSKLLKLAKIIN